MFKVRPIPADFDRSKLGWKVLVNGEEIVAEQVELVSGKWGHLTYGLRPEGYDSWVYRPVAVNAVTIPYCFKRVGLRRRLLVGLVEEFRHNMDGFAECAIGGFTEPGETIEAAERRESREEAGMEGRAFQLPGPPMVTDRLFWDASETAFAGVIPFAQKIAPNELYKKRPGEWHVLRNSKSFKNFGKASFLVFRAWGDAVQTTRDGIALSALARLRDAYDKGLL